MREAQMQQYRNDWERCRWQTSVLLSPHSKRPIDPKKLITFDWERKELTIIEEVLRIPQGSAFPAIAYNLVSIIPTPTKSGHSRTDFARVQVSIFAPTYQKCSEVADAVRTAFEAVALPGTFNTVKTQTIEFDGQQELTDDEADFAGVYQISQDYLINYTR